MIELCAFLVGLTTGAFIMHLTRDLTAEEIAEQIQHTKSRLASLQEKLAYLKKQQEQSK